MLKIKDNVNLKELEKYGFEYVETLPPNEYYFKKVYLNNDNDDKICYLIYKYGDREIQIVRLDGQLDDTLYDLIKADLVEKVGDDNE